MSIKTKRRLNKIADVPEKIMLGIINNIAWGIELLGIDFAHGKAKYRRRGAKPRPIIHRTYNRTYIVRQRSPIPERVHTVKTSR